MHIVTTLSRILAPEHCTSVTDVQTTPIVQCWGHRGTGPLGPGLLDMFVLELFNFDIGVIQNIQQRVFLIRLLK